MFNHASLFSGIGGFDLAAEWMGWNNLFHCEFAEFPKQILKYYWPKAVSYGDIKQTDFTIWNGRIDLISGGFPCQPYSTAGKRKGKEDDRHLWPEMLRAIREIQPRWVVGENVPGLISWNGGLVFEEVQADLEAEGYKVQPIILPAASVGAPHKRDRIWFVAYANERTARSSRTSRQAESNGSKNNDKQSSRRAKTEQHNGCREFLRTSTDNESESSRGKLQQRQEQGHFGRFDSEHDVTDTNDQRLEGRKKSRENSRKGKFKAVSRYINSTRFYEQTSWQNFPTQSPICNGNDGISERLDSQTILKTIGRKVNKRFKPFNYWRNESIKGGGNAIVPQVALKIFKAIEQYENLH